MKICAVVPSYDNPRTVGTVVDGLRRHLPEVLVVDDGSGPEQQRVLDAAGLHIITPEYNGSFPGVLKYFIDMLKFPESFVEKPVAFTGEAAGLWGARLQGWTTS